MDDLIERLRAGAGRWPIALLDEAADRIEALQRERDESRRDHTALQRAIVGDTGDSAILTAQRMRAQIAELQRERDEIRAAFEDSQAACRAAIEAGNDLVRDRDALSMECERRQQFAESAVRVLLSIHALLYPTQVVTTEAGKTYVFRPTTLDPYEVLQELSDRIRAIPSELDAARAALGGKHA